MNLKQQRQEFYKLLEKLFEKKISNDKIGYISEAIKNYTQSSNKNLREKIKELENKIENLKKIKPINKFNKPIKKEIDRIRVWRAK